MKHGADVNKFVEDKLLLFNETALHRAVHGRHLEVRIQVSNSPLSKYLTRPSF